MDSKWYLCFLSFFLLNYEGYSVEFLYGGSPCIPLEPLAPPLGCGAISGALVAYCLSNLSQIGREMGFKLFELVSP